MSTNPYITKSSKTVYQNPWIRIREDEIVRPDGSDGIYGVVESNNSVIVAVLNENQEILLVNSYSYPAQRWHWELPGGGGNSEEDYIEASKRELIEETGIDASRWMLLAETRVCDGLMTEKMATMLATGITMGDRPVSDDSQLIRDMKFVSLDEVYEMIKRDEIDEGQTLTALYLVERFLSSSPNSAG